MAREGVAKEGGATRCGTCNLDPSFSQRTRNALHAAFREEERNGIMYQRSVVHILSIIVECMSASDLVTSFLARVVLYLKSIELLQ